MTDRGSVRRKTVEDLEAASPLCERVAHRAWPRVLNALAPRLNPMLPAFTKVGLIRSQSDRPGSNPLVRRS
jgi:hypothetical protein